MTGTAEDGFKQMRRRVDVLEDDQDAASATLLATRDRLDRLDVVLTEVVNRLDRIDGRIADVRPVGDFRATGALAARLTACERRLDALGPVDVAQPLARLQRGDRNEIRETVVLRDIPAGKPVDAPNDAEMPTIPGGHLLLKRVMMGEVPIGELARRGDDVGVAGLFWAQVGLIAGLEGAVGPTYVAIFADGSAGRFHNEGYAWGTIGASPPSLGDIVHRRETRPTKAD